MLIEFLSNGLMASESPCVGFERNFVKLYVLHVGLLKHDAM